MMVPPSFRSTWRRGLLPLSSSSLIKAVILAISLLLIIILLSTTTTTSSSSSSSSKNNNHNTDIGMKRSSSSTTVRIAFVGNSFQFSNDFPRFFQDFATTTTAATADGTDDDENGDDGNDDGATKKKKKWWQNWLLGRNSIVAGCGRRTTCNNKIQIQQDSILHGNLSLVTLLQYGNGMYQRWGPNSPYPNYSRNAIMKENGLYDYGCCTVRQLLVGYDPILEELYSIATDGDTDDDDDGDDGDYSYYYYQDEYYRNDGFNPCFQQDDSSYLEYTLSSKKQNNTKTWDFIVMNDQSMRPAYGNQQNAKTLQVLQETYADMIATAATDDDDDDGIGPIPVFLVTYGYWRPDKDDEMKTKFVDIPTFSYRLHQGYTYYAQVLATKLPESQSPRLAPIGLAFLVVWEENYTLWQRLFQHDYFHPSPIGTYLMGCVLHITLFAKQSPPPPKQQFFNATELWWSRARGMQVSGDDPLPMPTYDEAIYLRWIANRVTRQGYIPKCLQDVMQQEEKEEDDALRRR